MFIKQIIHLEVFVVIKLDLLHLHLETFVHFYQSSNSKRVVQKMSNTKHLRKGKLKISLKLYIFTDSLKSEFSNEFIIFCFR